MDAFDTPTKVLEENDVTMLARIFRDASVDSGAGRWASRIRDRRHHRVVYETGVDVDAFGVKQASQVHKKLRTSHANGGKLRGDGDVVVLLNRTG